MLKIQENLCAYMAATSTIKLIGGRWKILILWKLLTEGRQRYSTLQVALDTVSEKMLSQVLREMVADQLIIREEIVKKAPKLVYYSISDTGKLAEPIIQEMIKFGESLSSTKD